MKNLIYTSGIANTSFQFGAGANAPVITIEDGIIHLPASLDMGDKKVATAFSPVEQEDVVNLKYLMESMNSMYNDCKDYTDKKVSGVSPSPSVNPCTFSHMAIPVTVSDLDADVEIGEVDADTVIDSIRIELTDGFTLASGATCTMCLRSNDDIYSELVELTELDKNIRIDIIKTLPSAESLYLEFVKTAAPVEPSDPADPPLDIDEISLNSHTWATVEATSDASGNVITLKYTGTAPADENIDDTESFPDAEGICADFGFIIDGLTVGHSYAISEDNMALAVSGLDDVTINSITCIRTTTLENVTDTQFVYHFLLTDNASEQYAHVYIRDLDSDTPDITWRTYHLNNLLTFPSSVPAPANMMAMSAAAPQVDSGSMIVHLITF